MQIMAYRLLARNQPLSQQLALALQGTLCFSKVLIWFYFYSLGDYSNFCFECFLALYIFYFKLYFLLIIVKRMSLTILILEQNLEI